MSEMKKGRATCPHCESKMSFETSRAAIKCPKCGKVFALSSDSEAGTKKKSAEVSTSGSEDRKEATVLKPALVETVRPTTQASHSFFSRIKLICVGGFTGLLASLALSGLKPSIGLSGFVGLLTLALATFGAAVLIKFLISLKAEQSHTIDSRSSFLNARLTSVSLMAAGFIGIVSLAFVAETFAPPVGLVRHFVFERNRAIAEKSKEVTDSGVNAKQEAETKKLEELAKQKKEMIAAFGQSDFFLINPAHRAVGLKVESKAGMPTFRIMAEAADEETQEPLLEAWNSKVPVIANSPQLARKVYEMFAPGDSIGGEFASEIRGLVVAKPFLPKGATTVSLELIEGKRKRVGYLLGDSEKEIVFCDLIPKRKLNFQQASIVSEDEILYETERIDRKQITNGMTSVIQTSEGIKAASDDFLDFCVYSILAKLDEEATSSSLSLPVRAAIYVDNVSVNTLVRSELERELESRLIGAEREFRDQIREQLMETPEKPQRSIWDKIGYTVLLIDKEFQRKEDLVYSNQLAKKDQLTEELRGRMLAEMDALKKKSETLKAMTFAGIKLQQELLSQLNKAGVVLVERSEKARMAYDKVSGDNWLRPGSVDAVRDKLVEATHLLLAEIDLPRDDGNIHVHIRLVDVATGEIRWNDVGSRKSLMPNSVSKSDSLKSVADGFSARTIQQSDIGGRWEGSIGTDAFVEFVFSSDGKIALPPGSSQDGKWELRDGELFLKWNSVNRNYRCQLTSNGMAFSGKETSGLSIRGRKISQNGSLINSSERTEAGGRGGSSFREYLGEDYYLWGLKLTKVRDGNDEVISSVQAVYRSRGAETKEGELHGSLTGAVVTLGCIDGYMVGGAVVRSGNNFDGLKLRLVPVSGSMQPIETKWFGGSRGDFCLLGDPGRRFVGIAGRSGTRLDALEFVYASQK